MNISFQRKTDLALAVMRTLKETDGRLSGTDLANRVGTTLTYLPQIVSPLIAAGWIRSGRGPGGGYELTKEADGLHLLDVLEVTEGPAESGRCILRDAPCPGETQCGVHAVWAEARDVLVAGLARIPVELS